MQDRERVNWESGLRAAVLRGDESAWQTWYHAHADDLSRYVVWRCGRNAEDVVQDAWLIAVRRIRDFQPGAGSFRNWLFGIAANIVRSRFRKKSVATVGQELDAVAAVEPDPDDTAARTVAALAELSERYESVLRAKYFDGKTVNEIAVEWNETPKAIESLLTRARDAFRQAFDKVKCPDG